MWTKTFGGVNSDLVNSVQQTSEGGFIATGLTKSFSAGDYGVWIIKTDEKGDTLWTKTYDREGHDSGNLVQQTLDGGYIITGVTKAFGEEFFGDVWLIKTDENGDTLWTKTFVGQSGLGDVGNSVQQTSDSGYIITGEKGMFSIGDGDIWLIKTDEKGNTLWTKTFDGGGTDRGNSVQQTSDGGYIVTGSKQADNLYPDVWLIKTKSNGDTVWARTFGGSNRDVGESVQQTFDDGYIIIGRTRSFGVGDYDVWIIKTDENGDTVWTKTFGESNREYGKSIQQTTDGGYIIAGHTTSFGAGNEDVWIIKTDENGDTVWTKTLGGSNEDFGESIQQTIEGGYIIAGITNSIGAGENDAWLIKLEADSPSEVINGGKIIPSSFSLSQNYPNPFNPATTINYQIPELSFVTLKAYDVLGNEIVLLVNDEKQVGSYEVEFDARTLPSGIYFYQLKAQNFVETKKMVLLR
jgi:hypothetical protein